MIFIEGIVAVHDIAAVSKRTVVCLNSATDKVVLSKGKQFLPPLLPLKLTYIIDPYV